MNKKTTTKTAKSGSVIIQTGSLDSLLTDPRDPLVGSLKLLLEPVDKKIDLTKYFSVNNESAAWKVVFGTAEFHVEFKHHELLVIGELLEDVIELGPRVGLDNLVLTKAYVQKLSAALAKKSNHGSELVLRVRYLEVPKRLVLAGVHEISRADRVEESFRLCLCGESAKDPKGVGASMVRRITTVTVSTVQPSKTTAPAAKVRAKPVKASGGQKPRKASKAG